MSAFANKASEWLAGLATGCERLVHPAVTCGEVRPRQSRLISALLVGPFLAAAAAAQALVPQFGAAIALALICALLAVSWLAAVLVTVTGKEELPGRLMLVILAPFVGLVVAASGGMASPMVVLAVALAVEAFWVTRTRRAILAGAAAMAAALIAQPVLASLFLSQPVAASGWHWLVPGAYAIFVAVRLYATTAPDQTLVADRFEAGLDDAIDAVVFHMGQNGEVIGASGKARSLLGLQPDLLLSTGLFERVHIADRVGYLSALADIRDGAGFRRCELRLRLPSGEDEPSADNYQPFVVEFSATASREQVIALLRSNRELSDLREALLAARESAAGGDIAKHRFLATVSHELRTPLNAIIGFSDMLAQGMCGRFDNPRQQEYVGLIRDSGDHLLTVVNAILDVSKIESGTYEIEPDAFPFKDAVDMCCAMMALQAKEKGVALNPRISDAAGSIVADRRSVKQILINLLSNAIKFTPSGGSVTIEANRLGSRLHVAISDDGIGIAEADLARLGTPFVQVQNDYTRNFEGTGLGLSLVKGLVGLHQGTMSIESAPGAGTTVAISLPVAGPDAAEPRQDKPLSGEVRPIKKTETNGEINGTIRKIA